MAMKERIGATTFETPSDNELLVTRVFRAPRRVIFDSWTRPGHVPHWMLGPEGWSMPVCEIDLRPGGAWHFVWRQADGSEMEMRGEYREVTPPVRLVSSESWGADWPKTINDLTLTEEGGATTVSMRIVYPTKEARDAASSTGMKDGMNLSFDRLEEYLRRIT